MVLLEETFMARRTDMRSESASSPWVTFVVLQQPMSCRESLPAMHTKMRLLVDPVDLLLLRVSLCRGAGAGDVSLRDSQREGSC